jgi:hypothetical protein
MKSIIRTELSDHPMEDVLDIESGTTITEYKEVLPATIVEHPTYDEKDTEIEQKIEEVYAMAIANAETISDEIERVEGKYKARIGEVSATMLNVALTAIREKRELKKHKDQMSVETASAGTPHTVNNNLVVADRNEILKMLRDKKKTNE